MQKRGLSDVVTTVLIILLVLAAVVLVWNFVRLNLIEGSESIQTTTLDVGKTVLSINPSSVQYDVLNSNLSFVVTKEQSISGANQTGFRVVVGDTKGIKKGFDYNYSLIDLQSKRIYVSLFNQSLDKPSSLEIYPLYQLPNGRKAVSSNPSVYNPSQSSSGGELVSQSQIVLNKSNLVAYWSFDDSSSPTKDSSGNGLNGILGGGVIANSPTWSNSGKIGGAYSFDRTNDYINMGPVRSNANLPFSASVWVNPSEVSSSWKTIIGEACGGFDLTLNVNLLTFGRNCGAGAGFFTGASLSSNQWAHVVLTYDGTNLILYKNGVSSAIGIGPYQTSSQTMYLGSYNGANELFNGLIDEVMIFNKTLSASEVANLCKYQNNFVSCG